VAKLTPPGEGDKQDIRSLTADIRRLRKGAMLKKITIRELIDGGHRY
jgi:hypothetical protein